MTESSATSSIGNLKRGTPVFIDERFIAADLHITFGFIEQHLMLGFSGGRKLVVPGLAAQETIKVIHSPRFMREPLATRDRSSAIRSMRSWWRLPPWHARLHLGCDADA